jgi:hypothetical protein
MFNHFVTVMIGRIDRVLDQHFRGGASDLKERTE